MFIICFFFCIFISFSIRLICMSPTHLSTSLFFYKFLLLCCHCVGVVHFLLFFFIFFLNYLFICSRYSCIITILIINVIKFFFIFILPLNVIIIGVVSFFLNVYLNVIATFPLQITLIR